MANYYVHNAHKMLYITSAYSITNIMDGWRKTTTTKEGNNMRRFRTGKWEIQVHDNGVVEFVSKKRTLFIPIISTDKQLEETFNALPLYVVSHFLRLLENDII